MISIYADGSSDGTSKGPIGWGWIVLNGTEVLDCGSGCLPVGTNNVAELMGAVEGLKAYERLKNTLGHYGIDPNQPIELVSDSQYVLCLASGRSQPTKNVELAVEVYQRSQALGAATRWVRGHSGEIWNEKCDELAKYAKAVYSKDNGYRKLERKKKRLEERKRRQKEK